MKINKTLRRVGVHKLSIPKAHPVKLIKTPAMPKVPKVKYSGFPKGHVY